MSKESYYAVARGKNVGIYSSWIMCKEQIEGFPNARYKKFSNMNEAADFVNLHKASSKPPGTSCSSSSYASTSASNSCKTASLKRRNFSESTGPVKKYLKTNLAKVIPVEESRTESSGSSLPSSAASTIPIVYTDGACSNNGQNKAKAGWGMFWGENHPKNSFGPVHGSATNNRGEILAVINAIKVAKECNIKEIIVRSDSQLCISSCDTWIKKWEKNGWRTATGMVKNKDLLVEIQELRKSVVVHFEKVKAHCGEPGNEAADELARRGAELYDIKSS